MPQLGINGLEPGFKYNIRVRGIFNGTPGPWSATEEIDVFSDTVAGTGDKSPSAVGSFTVTPTVDSFVLTWQAPTTNADGSVLKDMKDYVIEVRNDSQVGTLDATYMLPEYQKPSDLSTTERDRTFEFTYKMNKELYGGSGQPVLYFKVYARDATNNKSSAAQATGTNAAPSAPTSLTATATIGGANVVWGGGTSNDITGYVLKVSTSNGFDPLVAGTVVYSGPNTQFSFSGTAGTTYYFRVGSVDTFGQVSYYASQASATPINPSIDSTPPAPVTSLTDNWRGTSYVLNWTAPADADVVRYKIDIRNDANSLTKTFYSSATNFELTLQNNIDAFTTAQLDMFSVNVYAIDYSGNQSTAATLANPDAAPATPSGPALNTPILDPAGILISWPGVSDPNGIVDYFEVYGTGASSTTVLWTGLGTFFKYSLPSTYTGTYNFRSRTRDKFGRYSSYTSDVSITATSVLSAPTATVAAAFDAADPRNITGILNITSISPPSSPLLLGMKLRYKKSGDTNYQQFDLDKSTTAYIIRGILPATAYNVEIASYDIYGRTSTWGTVTNSPITLAADTTAPGSVTSVDLTAGATSINVDWTGVSDTDVINGLGHYDVEIATNSGFSTGLLRQTHAAGASGATGFASFGGLTPATTYWARVRAVDYNGNNGSWVASTPTSLAVGSAGGSSDGNVPSTTPTPTAISGIGGIHLRWTAIANNDPVTYEVHVGTSSGFSPGAGTLVGEVSGTYFFSKVDGAGSALAYGTNYFFKLRSKDQDGPAAAYGSASGSANVLRVDGGTDITDGTVTTAKIVDAAITAAKLGAAIGGGNLLLGSSFEQDANSDGIADNWTAPTSGTITSTPTISSAEKIYGANSQRINVTGSTTTGFRSVLQSGTIPAGAVTKLTLSYWYKGSRTGTGQLNAVLSNSGVSSFAELQHTPTSTWQRGSVTWTVGGAETTWRVELRARAYTIGDTIDLYLDGVQLEVGDVPTSYAPKPDEILPGTVGTTEIAALAVTAAKIAANTITAAQIAANTITATEINANAIGTSELAAGAVTANKLAVIIGGGNILYNAGLEAWSAGLPVGWTKGGSTTITQVTGRLGVGSAARHTATTAGNVGTNRLSQALTTDQTLAASTTYTLSAYVKRNSGTGDLSIALDGLSTYVLAGAATTPAISSSWQRFSVTFTTGGTAPTPFAFFNTVANDVFEIDDVQLEVGDVPTAWAPQTKEILPGTIIATMIATDTITANEIASNAITVNELAANAVTAAKIAAGVIDTTHINATGINADKINIGGNASNMVPSEWADFELTSTFYDAGGAVRPAFVGTPTLVQTSATQAKFGTRALAVTVDAASEGVYFNTSSTTYNIPVLNGKTYIISAYVYSTLTSSTGATLRVKPNGGADTTLSNLVDDTTASTWTRVYGTYTAAADTTVNISIIFAATSGIQYIDGVMMEERVGTQNVPSGFVKPGTVIDGASIVTGSMNADRIVAGTVTTTQIAANTITAADIAAGTITSTEIAANTITAADIAAGTITATEIAASGITANKLQIGGTGLNLIPPQWSDFEFDPYYYVGKMDGANATAVTDTSQKFFNAQSIKVTTTVQPNNTIFLGINNTDYNFKVLASTTYIFSAYVYHATGSNQTLSFRYKNQAAAQTDVALTTVVGGTTNIASGSWQRVYATITTGASDTDAVLGFRSFNAVGTYWIDGVMIEKQVGNQVLPSPFAGATQTIIDGDQIITGSLETNRIALGLFGSNQIINGSFEDTGYYPRVKQRVPATLSNTGTIPGWTTQRIGGDTTSFHALEWGDYSTDENIIINPWFNAGAATTTSPTTSTGWALVSSGTLTGSASISPDGTTPVESIRILQKESSGTNRIVTLEKKVDISTIDKFTVTDLTNYTGTAMGWGSLPVTFDAALDTVNTTNPHTLENGDALAFTTITTTTGIFTSLTYYVVNATSTSFQLADAPDGVVKALTNNGTGAFTPLSPTYRLPYTAAGSLSESLVAATPNGFLTFTRAQRLNPTAMSSGAIYGVSQSVPITYGSTTPLTGNFKHNITSLTSTGLRYRLTGQISVASVTVSGTNLVTVTTSQPHGLATSDSVDVEGIYLNNDIGASAPNAHNGTKTITVTGATTFTYAASGATNATWVPSAAKINDNASMVQSSSITSPTGSWATSAAVTITPNGFFDSIKVAIVVVATAGTASMNVLVDTATLRYGSTVVTDPFTFTQRARSGQSKAILGKADTSTTRGTSLTSDPVAVTADQTYNLGFYYYGDINQRLDTTFEYSATTNFSSPTVTVPVNGTTILGTTLTPATAESKILQWDAPANGYVRVVYKNSGTAEKGTVYVEDVWLSVYGRTSGELTDAGIRLFDEKGNETVSLMADSSESGDFIKLGSGMNLDGATNSIQAGTASLSDGLVVGGTDVAAFLANTGQGILGRANRSSNEDFVNADKPHANWSGGVTYNSGAPYLELSVDNLVAGRDYRITCGPLRIFNTNANSTFADVMLGYRMNATTIPAIPRADTSGGLTEVIQKYRLGKQANQNVTMGYATRTFAPTTSGNYRFLIFGGSDVASPAGSVRFDGDPESTCQMIVEDMGVAVPSSGVARHTGDYTDTRKITRTVTFDPKWFGYYGDDGALLESGTATGLKDLGGVFANRVLYVVYDQLVSSTDVAGVYPDSDITKVELQVNVYAGQPVAGNFHASTGAAYPYTNVLSIPNVSNYDDRYFGYSGLRWEDISFVGSKKAWGGNTGGADDGVTDFSSTQRYRGIYVKGNPSSGMNSKFSIGIGKLRITYNVVE